MKYLALPILFFFSIPLFSQNLQLHYDLRHTIDPAHNSRNFPTIYFEYFKSQNDTTSFIKTGSFFLKAEDDLQGDGGNIGKAFIQTSQSFRFWKRIRSNGRALISAQLFTIIIICLPGRVMM